jgi:CDP-diacylglycerol--serine O-phosphatidyltransferase
VTQPPPGAPGAPAAGDGDTWRGYFRAALRDEWDGLDRINRDLRLADLFTLTNALMGLAALLLIATAPYEARWDRIHLAIELVLVGVIMDGVDGAVSRMGKGNGPLGAVLDTLADALTFVATSAVVTFVFIDTARGGETDPFLDRWGSLLALGFYVVCGLLRLARFESLRDTGKPRDYFSGIPTPAAALMLLAMVLVESPDWLLLSAAFVLGILMTTRARYPKIRGWIAVGTVAILLAILVSFSNPDFQAWLARGLLALMALYVLAGPFVVLARHGANFPGSR